MFPQSQIGTPELQGLPHIPDLLVDDEGFERPTTRMGEMSLDSDSQNKSSEELWKAQGAVRDAFARMEPFTPFKSQYLSPKESDEVAQRYNTSYEADYRTRHPVSQTGLSQKVIVRHNTVYGNSGIDQSTIDTFAGYNFDTRTMTREDRKKIDTLLSGDELKMPQWDRMALAKVKLLDRAADKKEKIGARPVKYEDIPVSKWAQKEDPKKVEKKSFWKSLGSGVASVAKKIWPWK